jgi:hypothetical protein
MPLNASDRFFSVHSSTHYAIYIWQPNRGRWGEDDPIETLAIWDISTPSTYLPSLDPTGAGKPSESEGPRVIRRFSFSDLDFYKIRQRSTPCLRELQIDEGNLYIIEENHENLTGRHASYSHPVYHEVKSTSIPFANGPRRVDRCGADVNGHWLHCNRIIKMRQPWQAPCWRHEVVIDSIDKSYSVLQLTFSGIPLSHYNRSVRRQWNPILCSLLPPVREYVYQHQA